MSSVSLSSVNRAFTKADIDGNGTLDRPELAKASLNLMGQEDEDSQAVGQLFATFVQGGKDGKGIMPDFDNDQAISKSELGKLAAFDANKNDISSEDFKVALPDNFQEGGNSIDMDGLKEIGSQNKSKFNFDPENPETFVNSVSNLNPEVSSLMNGLMGMFQQMMGMFQKLLGGQG